MNIMEGETKEVRQNHVPTGGGENEDSNENRRKNESENNWFNKKKENDKDQTNYIEIANGEITDGFIQTQIDIQKKKKEEKNESTVNEKHAGSFNAISENLRNIPLKENENQQHELGSYRNYNEEDKKKETIKEKQEEQTDESTRRRINESDVILNVSDQLTDAVEEKQKNHEMECLKEKAEMEKHENDKEEKRENKLNNEKKKQLSEHMQEKIKHVEGEKEKKEEKEKEEKNSKTEIEMERNDKMEIEKERNDKMEIEKDKDDKMKIKEQRETEKRNIIEKEKKGTVEESDNEKEKNIEKRKENQNQNQEEKEHMENVILLANQYVECDEQKSHGTKEQEQPLKNECKKNGHPADNISSYDVGKDTNNVSSSNATNDHINTGNDNTNVGDTCEENQEQNSTGNVMEPPINNCTKLLNGKNDCKTNNSVVTHVFLGNIPPNISDERLKNVLEIFGSIMNVEYKWSVAKWSYAFVSFSDEQAATNAVQILNQKKFFDNSPNHKLICFIVSKQTAFNSIVQTKRANFSLLKDGPPGANLFLYGIPLTWTELNLIQLVNKYGHVVGLRIPYSNKEKERNQMNRGFGFVSYDNKKSAIDAFEGLSKISISGKVLKVQLKNGEEHLLPDELKIIYNNVNRLKDGITKSSQSFSSTTDTLKTMNSSNSTDIKGNSKKNGCSISLMKLGTYVKHVGVGNTGAIEINVTMGKGTATELRKDQEMITEQKPNTIQDQRQGPEIGLGIVGPRLGMEIGNALGNINENRIRNEHTGKGISSDIAHMCSVNNVTNVPINGLINGPIIGEQIGVNSSVGSFQFHCPPKIPEKLKGKREVTAVNTCIVDYKCNTNIPNNNNNNNNNNNRLLCNNNNNSMDTVSATHISSSRNSSNSNGNTTGRDQARKSAVIYNTMNSNGDSEKRQKWLVRDLELKQAYSNQLAKLPNEITHEKSSLTSADNTFTKYKKHMNYMNWGSDYRTIEHLQNKKLMFKNFNYPLNTCEIENGRISETERANRISPMQQKMNILRMNSHHANIQQHIHPQMHKSNSFCINNNVDIHNDAVIPWHGLRGCVMTDSHLSSPATNRYKRSGSDTNRTILNYNDMFNEYNKTDGGMCKPATVDASPLYMNKVGNDYTNNVHTNMLHEAHKFSEENARVRQPSKMLDYRNTPSICTKMQCHMVTKESETEACKLGGIANLEEGIKTGVIAERPWCQEKWKNNNKNDTTDLQNENQKIGNRFIKNGTNFTSVADTPNVTNITNVESHAHVANFSSGRSASSTIESHKIPGGFIKDMFLKRKENEAKLSDDVTICTFLNNIWYNTNHGTASNSSTICNRKEPIDRGISNTTCATLCRTLSNTMTTTTGNVKMCSNRFNGVWQERDRERNKTTDILRFNSGFEIGTNSLFNGGKKSSSFSKRASLNNNFGCPTDMENIYINTSYNENHANSHRGSSMIKEENDNPVLDGDTKNVDKESNSTVDLSNEFFKNNRKRDGSFHSPRESSAKYHVHNYFERNQNVLHFLNSYSDDGMLRREDKQEENGSQCGLINMQSIEKQEQPIRKMESEEKHKENCVEKEKEQCVFANEQENKLEPQVPNNFTILREYRSCLLNMLMKEKDNNAGTNNTLINNNGANNHTMVNNAMGNNTMVDNIVVNSTMVNNTPLSNELVQNGNGIVKNSRDNNDKEKSLVGFMNSPLYTRSFSNLHNDVVANDSFNDAKQRRNYTSAIGQANMNNMAEHLAKTDSLNNIINPLHMGNTVHTVNQVHTVNHVHTINHIHTINPVHAVNTANDVMSTNTYTRSPYMERGCSNTTDNGTYNLSYTIFQNREMKNNNSCSTTTGTPTTFPGTFPTPVELKPTLMCDKTLDPSYTKKLPVHKTTEMEKDLQTHTYNKNMLYQMNSDVKNTFYDKSTIWNNLRENNNNNTNHVTNNDNRNVEL